MSEIVVGDVVARLRADVSQFNQAIADVLQRLTQLNQASATARTQQSQGQQSTTQLASAYATLAQATTQQAHATTQATQAGQAYRQVQAQSATAAQQQVQQYGGVTQALQQTTQAATTAGQGLRTAFAVAGGIGIATGIGALAGQMKELAVNAVQVGVRFEALRASLSALGGSTTAGVQQFQMLVDTAQRLGVALEPLARGWRSLTAAASQAGLPLADQQRLLTALATEGRRVGASNEELGRAITAVSQVASKGVLSMEELRQQLGEALPTALAATAKGMGITTEELTKLVETGSVRFPAFARALTRGFEEMQAGAGALGETSQQAFNRLATAWKQLQDAVINSGFNTYLVTVIGNLKEAVEWTDKMVRGVSTTVPIGPQRADIGIAPRSDIDKQLQVLEARIATARAGVAGARTTQRQEELGRIVTELESQRTVLMENAQATQVQAEAQGKVTAEANRTTKALDLQRDHVEAVRTTLQTMAKETADFRAKAAQAPNVFGDPRGTAEQQMEFARRERQLREDQTEKLAALQARAPAGTVLPPELRREMQGYDLDVGKLTTSLDRMKDAQQAASKAARDLAAEQKAAVTQAIALDATLERLQGMTRRPSENQAEEAATRVRTQYAGAVAEAQKLIVELERSKTLQQARPEALAQARAVRDALVETGEAQARIASDEVLKRQIAPLEAIALRYGAVTLEITSQGDRVQELASKYGLATKEAIDLAEAEKLAASFTGTARQEAAEKYLDTITKTIEARQKIEAQVPGLEQEALASFGPGAAAVRGAGFTRDLETQLAQLQASREERLTTRLRGQARRRGVELDADHEALLRQIEAQQRWNSLMGMAERVGDQAAQTITSGLLGIVEGTQRVGEAFQQMARSILHSISEIALNEGFKLLIQFGLRAAGAALGGGAGGFSNVGASAGGGGQGFEILMAQSGAVVNKPTLVMAGENPATSPEYILNRPQMQAMMGAAMRASPSAGGQGMGGDVAVILVDNRGQAERAAAEQRGLGKRVIIQEVINDLSMGSGSSIGRMIRAGGH